MIPGGWCEAPDKSKFILRLYSIVPCSIAQIKERSSGQSSFPTEDGVPVWLGLCELQANNLLRLGSGQVHSDPETGRIIVPTNVDSFDLPRSAYFLLATPHEIDGVSFEEADTLSRLDRLEALLSIHFGSNAVYRRVFQAIFEARPDGDYSVVGDEMAVIQPSDGPDMAPDNWWAFEEACSCIEALTDVARKERLRRALEFYHGGKSSPDTARGEKFFFYWTALRILGEGNRTLHTNSQLQVIYGFSKEEVEGKLLWKRIVELRNDFFYAGKKIHLYKDAERYLQLLILDLFRHELGLDPLRAALSAQPKLDLSIFR